MFIPRPGRPSKLAELVDDRTITAATFFTESRSPNRIVLLDPSGMVATVIGAGRLFTSGPTTSRLIT